MKNFSKILNSIDYIEDNLKQKIKVRDLARGAFYSEYHFHRLFYRVTGTNVNEYIRKRRMAEAANELLATNNSITEIALNYQFSSPESFTRAFKRMYGITPGVYRKGSEDILLFKKLNTLKARNLHVTSCTKQLRMAA